MRPAVIPFVVVAITSVFFYEQTFRPGFDVRFNPENTQTIATSAILPTIVLTFPEIEEKIPLNTPYPPTATPTPWTPYPLQDYQSLVDFCERYPSASGTKGLEELGQVTFPSDVPQRAQDELPAKIDIQPSCNFETSNQPRAIVLHYTEGPLAATISTFQQPHKSSAHYVIDRDGRVTQLVPERFAAFHVTCYGVRSKCAPSCPVCSDTDGKFMDPIYQTVGIELVNLGHVDPRYYQGDIFEDFSDSFGYRYWQDYPAVQIRSLQILINNIRARWGIPIDMVIGHYRINNNTDPGPALNLFWFRNGAPSRPAILTPGETLTPWDSPS